MPLFLHFDSGKREEQKSFFSIFSPRVGVGEPILHTLKYEKKLIVPLASLSRYVKTKAYFLIKITEIYSVKVQKLWGLDWRYPSAIRA